MGANRCFHADRCRITLDVVADLLDCPGVLLRHGVTLADGAPAAVIECSACGFVAVSTGELDGRHRDALVLAVEG
jgi:hypothetical protein